MIRLDTVQAVSIVGKIKVMSLVLDGIERLCVDNAVFSFWKDGRGRARQEDKCRFFGCHLDLLGCVWSSGFLNGIGLDRIG